MENEMKASNKDLSQNENVLNHRRRSARLRKVSKNDSDTPQSPTKLPITNNCGEDVETEEICSPSKVDNSMSHQCGTSSNKSSKTSSSDKLLPNQTQGVHGKCSFKVNGNDSNIETDIEDISTIYKIISKPLSKSPQVFNSNKTVLKTYANPRKFSQKSNVTESFALPDTPLDYSKSNLSEVKEDKNLDAKIFNPHETTILDFKLDDNKPWKLMDLEENFFNINDIRIKPPPQVNNRVNKTKNFTGNVYKDFNITPPSPKIDVIDCKEKHSHKNIFNGINLKYKNANRSLALDDNEVEIFSSSTLKNSSELTSIKTNILNQISHNGKNVDNQLMSDESKSMSKNIKFNEGKNGVLKSQNKNRNISKNFIRVLRSNSCTDLRELDDKYNNLKKSKSQSSLNNKSPRKDHIQEKSKDLQVMLHSVSKPKKINVKKTINAQIVTKNNPNTFGMSLENGDPTPLENISPERTEIKFNQTRKCKTAANSKLFIYFSPKPRKSLLPLDNTLSADLTDQNDLNITSENMLPISTSTPNRRQTDKEINEVENLSASKGVLEYDKKTDIDINVKNLVKDYEEIGEKDDAKETKEKNYEQNIEKQYKSNKKGSSKINSMKESDFKRKTRSSTKEESKELTNSSIEDKSNSYDLKFGNSISYKRKRKINDKSRAVVLNNVENQLEDSISENNNSKNFNNIKDDNVEEDDNSKTHSKSSGNIKGELVNNVIDLQKNEAFHKIKPSEETIIVNGFKKNEEVKKVSKRKPRVNLIKRSSKRYEQMENNSNSEKENVEEASRFQENNLNLSPCNETHLLQEAIESADSDKILNKNNKSENKSTKVSIDINKIKTEIDEPQKNENKSIIYNRNGVSIIKMDEDQLNIKTPISSFYIKDKDSNKEMLENDKPIKIKTEMDLNESPSFIVSPVSKPRGRPRTKNLDVKQEESEFSLANGASGHKLPKQILDEIEKRVIPDYYPYPGDLAWAQIGNYPYWPCIISYEPYSENYKKNITKRGKGKTCYHVRFFGDNGRRAWIFSHKLIKYNNKDDLKNIYNTLISIKPSSELQMFNIKPTNTKWMKAINEVEYVRSERYNLEDVMKFMKRLKAKNQSIKTEPKEGHKKKIKEIKSEPSEPLHVAKKIKLSSKIVKLDKSIKQEGGEAISDTYHNKEIVNEGKDIKIEDVILKDEISNTEYKVNPMSVQHFGTYSLEEQRALFKRNNLFKGVPKEKVCQYCLNFEDVLKCKGCSGMYHQDCAMEILIKKIPKRKKIRLNKKDNVENISVKSDQKDLSTLGNQIEADEGRVKIISVPSSVCPTPPKKTFPPDFADMTLAERIDFKMKEIMKKFDSPNYRKMYDGSTSDENSSPSRCQKSLFTDNSKIPNEVLENTIKSFSNHTSDDSLGTPISTSKKIKQEVLVSHVTAESELIQEEENASNKLKKNKSIKLNSDCFTPPGKTLNDLNGSNGKLNGAKKALMKSVTAESEYVISLDTLKQSEIEDNKSIDPKQFKCGFCIEDVDPYCFICQREESKKGCKIRQKCSLYQCSRYYHPDCLKSWPLTQWSLIQTTKNRNSHERADSFVCPQHFCHTCASEDPHAANSRCAGDKITKCLYCPASYHSTNLCIPAGTEIISSSQNICPRHIIKTHTINTTWCFICNKGGKLICCETCPTSVHPECMTLNLNEDDKFICEDCESGRLPLYDEIVWVKVGCFKWWPGLIIFPNEIPSNVLNAKHSSGEFVVKFFGTYNYFWVNKGRSFLFQDGDTVDKKTNTKNKSEVIFERAVQEAVVAHNMKKRFRLTQTLETASSLKPPPYIRIKASKPVGNVRLMDLNLSNTTACDCNPSQPNPCGPESNCLNRLLWTECNPEVCPAGERCNNQLFEKREYPPLVPYKTESRGWGLKTLAPIKKGQFVIEYVGELIDDDEYQRRIQKMHEQKEENFYFLIIHSNRMIDAGPKGNVARFMNHCCQPNCETQKWTVNGETRVGLFATEDIPADTELTFNYNLECTGTEKKVCKCGAPNCSGFIGVKAKQETTERKKSRRSSNKKKQPVKEIVLPPCFVCQKTGDVEVCNNKMCNRAYHLDCLKLKEPSEGKKFICPWHSCNICSKRTIRCCVKCLNSFCPAHSDGNISYDNLLGFVCSDHEMLKSQNKVPILKKRKGAINSDDAIVSSTTDSTDEDDVSLILRQQKSKKFKKHLNHNTYLKIKNSDTESQDETVSSATTSETENVLKIKRKLKRKKGFRKILKR